MTRVWQSLMHSKSHLLRVRAEGTGLMHIKHPGSPMHAACALCLQ